MSTTITIRTDEALREALQERARVRGSTVSEVAREILRTALELESQPLGVRTAHLRGRLTLDGVVRTIRPDEDPWRRVLHRQNWRE